MTQKTIEVTNELGVHLRAAARVVAITSRSRAQVWIGTGDVMVDGKSLLGITSLLARQGAMLTIRAQGEGEQDVVDAVVALVRSGFVE